MAPPLDHAREYHDATPARFLDDRGSMIALCPNGVNPATVMEKTVRERIVSSRYFQDACFGLNEADIVTRCVEHVRFVAGIVSGFGGTSSQMAGMAAAAFDQTPSPFLCLAFKLLQLAPSDDIVLAYMRQGGERFKYLRCLACFYWRITRRGPDCWRVLEPFLADRRKIRRPVRRADAAAANEDNAGKPKMWRIGYVDEFIDDLLTVDRVCATSLNKIPRRRDLEDMDVLEPRKSELGDVDELLEGLESEGASESERGKVKSENEKNDDGSDDDYNDLNETRQSSAVNHDRDENDARS